MKATGVKVARILIVDDHPIVREGFARLVANQPDLEVCGEAADEVEGVRMAAATQPDLIVVDITLKSSNGLGLIARLKKQNPAAKVLVASAHDESLYAERALQGGAQGYVSKEEAVEHLIIAIRQVLSGKVYLSQKMTERVLGRASISGRQVDQSSVDSLSNRELEAYGLIGEGLATGEIARRMHISPRTVDRYRENIKHKLGLSNAAELARHAMQWKLEGH